MVMVCPKGKVRRWESTETQGAKSKRKKVAQIDPISYAQ